MNSRFGIDSSPSTDPLSSRATFISVGRSRLTNKEIAQDLRLSEKTVKNYLANIYSKLNIGRRSQIAAFYAGSFKGSGRHLSMEAD